MSNRLHVDDGLLFGLIGIALLGGTIVLGFWLTDRFSPQTFTDTCRYKYRDTPISQVPTGCINSRGGLE